MTDSATADLLGDSIADDAVALVETWLRAADEVTTDADRRTAQQLDGVVSDPAGVKFAMRFVDRVIRPDDARVAAGQLVELVDEHELPGFLSRVDRVLLRTGARLAPILPQVVMPLAKARMRSLIGHLVVDADRDKLAEHLAQRRDEGFALNVNLLGEAVLGDREADRRHAEAMELLEQPDVDYVSVKLSAIVSQLNYWDYDTSIDRVVERLRPLYRKAASSNPATFINLDMEEYHDLELTMTVFMRLLDEPEFRGLQAGIVLQAYLPDSLGALQRLVRWADQRDGADIKIRLVKGANLAMEEVESAMRGWPLAPYGSKHDTDANYKRCLDWVLTPERTRRVRIGVASHNLFDVAWARLLSGRRGVADRVEFEMLQGMAVPEARVIRDEAGGVLLYTPAVRRDDFDVAISYLFRRLEENAADENFIRHLFDLEPGSPTFQREADKFRAALAERWQVSAEPSRLVEDDGSSVATDVFDNEPDSDPSVPAVRRWAAGVMSQPFTPLRAGIIDDVATVDRAVASAATARREWAARSADDRRRVLWAAADQLAARRGDLINTMVHEANKTFEQADVEVSEAIDFSRYYGDRALELVSDHATFEPLGVIAVVPPWNFPVAIPAGGVLASLAAGNAVLFKPAPEVRRCAEVVAECLWAAGVPTDLLQFTPTHDDDVGRHLITHDGIAAVILTGAYETAALFRSWKPGLRIFAETSGKNALIITPNADLDEAVADLAAGAFGHSGQKCSASSLAICVGEVYESERFRRQLVDAVESLQVGPSTDLGTNLGPTIAEPAGKLLRGLTQLDEGEEWLVEPRRVDDGLWSPGIRTGVQPGSWFHRTECFGPVLGIMAADSLDEAIELQNAVDYGLTGGIHSLDPSEADHWLEHVDVGNAYINRVITGAIVQRQPFGGWKRSSIGPGAKAGGPNYIAQLGTWVPAEGRRDDAWLASARDSDAAMWAEHFSVDHDPTGLFCEANVFRYRPVPRVVLRREADGDRVEFERVRSAAQCTAAEVMVSNADTEPAADFAARVGATGAVRLRVVGSVDPSVRYAANDAGIHVADDPVTADGRIELLHYLREQAISRTLHRHGNLV